MNSQTHQSARSRPSRGRLRLVVRSGVSLVAALAIALGVVSTGTAAANAALPAAPSSPAPTPTDTASPTPSGTASPAAPSTPTPEPSSPATPSPTPADPAPQATPPTTGPGAYMGQGEQRIMLGKSPTDSSVTPSTARAATPFASWMAPGTQGLDVSGWQPNVDWRSQWNMGARFVYIKASEGIDYTSSNFSNQWAGATSNGFIRGAYHFAIPSASSGATQANYLVDHGGGWTGDGRTLPPLLDIEYNPYGPDTCYGMAGWPMELWIRDFSNQILARTGRLPAIYSTANWWNQCTNSDGGFGANPLHIARYSTSVGPMPAGWSTYNIWQYSSTGPFTGDSNAFNGSETDLSNFATFADGRGASLQKSSASPTVYIVNGLTKYPIPDLATYSLYTSLGSIHTVAQSALDGLSTGTPVGRFMRSGDGSIYLNDNGNKYHVQSCAQMSDFGAGANCAGWVPLPDGQINQFPDSGTLRNAVRTTSGKRLYVSNATVRQYFDPASLSAAGYSSQEVSLSDAVVSGMPRSGNPIIRPDVIVVSSDDGKVYLFTQGKLLPIPASINDQNVWARPLTAALLDNASIGKLTLGSPYTGFVTNTSGGTTYLVSGQGKYTVTDPSAWPNASVVFSDSLLAALPQQGSVNSPAFLKADGGSVVYRYASRALRSISTWTTFTSLNTAGTPIVSLTQAVMDGLTKGAPLQSLPSQVVTSSSPTVYVVDDVDKLVPIEDFAVSSQLGINGYNRVDDSALSPYTRGSVPLNPVISCGSTTYLGRSSSLVRLPSNSATAQLPATALSASTCSALGVPGPASGALAQQVFVKTSTGSTVYVLQNGTKRPVSSWQALINANGGSSDVVIAIYGQAAVSAIPTGSAIS